jgi:hypothetical protein
MGCVSPSISHSDLPDRRSGKSLSSPSAKTFPFSLDANHFIRAAVSSHQEGRLAIVTNAGRDAMDADLPLTNGTEADDEVAWF